MLEDRKYWLALSAFVKIGPVRFKYLYDYFGSAEAIWKADINELVSIKLGYKLAESFVKFRKTFSPDRFNESLIKNHIGTLTINDLQYPENLRQIIDPPFVLYVKGQKLKGTVNLKKAIGIVGTRKITPYGHKITVQFTRELVAEGFVIISGMADGVDTLAHKIAIESGGFTIGVIGCGIDIAPGPKNKWLYDSIADRGHGAIVAEMPPGYRPEKNIFTARNRIISGLSLGVLVTEGDEKSGSLITAGYSVDQGREVFAVPGPVDSIYSRAPLKLIKNGAKLVENTADILEELNVSK